MWRDGHITLGEALARAQRDGRTVADAEMMICKQAADYFDEMAEQIITPINSKARKILQDMAAVIRLTVTKYAVVQDQLQDWQKVTGQSCGAGTVPDRLLKMSRDCPQLFHQFEGDGRDSCGSLLVEAAEVLAKNYELTEKYAAEINRRRGEMAVAREALTEANIPAEENGTTLTMSQRIKRLSERSVRRRRLLERCASHLAGRHTGHSDACICEGCRLIAEIRAMDQ